MRKTIEIIKARNIIGLASSSTDSLDLLDKWKQEGGDRILPAIPFEPMSGKPTVDQLRQLVKTKQIDAFAEVSTQYFGVAPNDPRMEPYYALAEELDVPMAFTWDRGHRARHIIHRRITACVIRACFCWKTFWFGIRN